MKYRYEHEDAFSYYARAFFGATGLLFWVIFPILAIYVIRGPRP